MRIAYNYTPIRQREHRVYSIQDMKISSSGISTTLIGLMVGCLVLVNILGLFACLITGKFLYSPFGEGGSFDSTFLMVMIGGPIALAFALYNLKIQNYRLFEFLLLYLKPKHPVDQHNDRLECHSASLHGIFEMVNVDILKKNQE